jgi:peptide/nickel transport system permease protein
MYKFILKRLVMLIPVLLGVSFIVFTIMNLAPGDPVVMYLGDNYTKEAYQAKAKELGLDQPFLVRYLKYIGNAATGNLGTSYSTGRPVIQEISARLPSTLLLAASAIIFAVLVGIPLGTLSAVRQYSVLDSLSMFLALIGVSMPNFWFGIMLILVFAATLKWLPSANFNGFKSLILPAITLSAASLAIITRMTRSSMLEMIRQDYIRTARAKGHKEMTVIVRHALRNALIPVVTIVGLQFGFAIGGAVLVETVFSWPGIGRLLVQTIELRDIPTVMAIVLIIAFIFTIINLCIDIFYAFLDPRIRAQY